MTVNDMQKTFGTSCFPLQNNCYAKMLEYYLIMQVYKEKGMIADYMLRLSPLGAEIGNRHLAKAYGFNLLKNNKLDINKIPNELRKHIINQSYFDRSTYVCLKEVIELIGAYARMKKTEDFVLDKLAYIRTAEREIRNLAAHMLEPITAELVKDKTGIL